MKPKSKVNQSIKEQVLKGKSKVINKVLMQKQSTTYLDKKDDDGGWSEYDWPNRWREFKD